MIKNHYIVLIILLFIISCKNEKNQTVTEQKPQEEVTENSKIQPPVFLDSLKTENEILKHLQNRKIEISSHLKNSSPENAGEIYENLKKENDSALLLLALKQMVLLEKYYQFNDYNNETQILTQKFPDDVKKIIDRYEKTGIEFWEIGEGMTELRMFPDYYLKLFTGRLTADYQQYLEIISEEDKFLFAADAGIIIPWRDVALRVEVREKFLKSFPNSKLAKKIKDELKDYRYAYLAGYDNTQTNEKGIFFPENVKEFRRFVKENPNSETSKIIVEMLAQKRNSEELWSFIKQRI